MMKSIIEQKKEIRKIFKSKRMALSLQEVTELSHQISENFIKNLLPQICLNTSNKNFSLYLDSQNEVSTKEIAQYFFTKNISFSYPKIIKLNHHLTFIKAIINQELSPNKFYPNILEPKSQEEVSPEFIIIPLVAFDNNLSRLGMGGGFFDRTIEFLKQQNSQIKTIGLAYEFQRLKAILPTENSDQRLDFIVTEKSLFVSKPTLR